MDDVSETGSHDREGLYPDPNTEQESEQTGATIRARFPQPQANEGEDESISIRFIMPNSSILTVNTQCSTTLGELRRYVGLGLAFQQICFVVLHVVTLATHVY